MKTFLYILIPVFAGTVYGYCIFLFVSFAGADAAMDYNYFAVLICAVFAAIVNYRLSLRDQTVQRLAVFNSALIVLVEIVGFSFYNEIEGIILHAVAAIVFLAPVIHSLMLSRRQVSANTMLIFCELSVVGTIAFMGIQLGYFEAPARATVLSVVCLACCLIMLSSLRTDAPSLRKTENKKQAERGVILAAACACAVFAAGAVVIFVLPAVRGALLGAAAAIGRFFVFLGDVISGFFVWFIGLFPEPAPIDAEPLPPAESLPQTDGGDFEALPEFPDEAKLFLVVVIFAAAVAFTAFFVIKIRRKRLRSTGRVVRAVYEDIEHRNRFSALFLTLLRRLFRRIVFARMLFLRRDTYEGFFVRLSVISGRRGFARAAPETPADYLNRLSMALEGFPAPLLTEVCARIDRMLYARGGADERGRQTKLSDADKVQASRLLRAAKRMGRGKNDRE